MRKMNPFLRYKPLFDCFNETINLKTIMLLFAQTQTKQHFFVNILRGLFLLFQQTVRCLIRFVTSFIKTCTVKFFNFS